MFWAKLGEWQLHDNFLKTPITNYIIIGNVHCFVQKHFIANLKLWSSKLAEGTQSIHGVVLMKSKNVGYTNYTAILWIS